MDHDLFSDILTGADFFPVLDGQSAVAVGVSGGPDSMALLILLAQWAAARGVVVYAITLDHGLRAGAAAEAAQVAVWSEALGVKHVTLCWEGEKPDSAVQERARAARYDVITRYCKGNGIGILFLGHHMDDQAETVLFRLAKGSGLKGLGGMSLVQARSDLLILRPLLHTPKSDLVALCRLQGQDFIDDPSNENENFARVRLRAAADVLAAEGLTAKRLCVTAARLRRAEEALMQVSDAVWRRSLINNPDRIVFNFSLLSSEPFDIFVRVIIKAIEHFYPDADYLPRMERIEALCADLYAQTPFQKRTLGGLVFVRDDQRGEVVIFSEETLVSCGK
jgi:tRNA(Ile)-lysidine synthase